jgi:hemerythrin-like domain-containing protein
MSSNAAVDMLVHEHKVILKVVDGLRQAVEQMRSGNRVNPALLREAVAFMREFADKCHHAKEEDLLFPALVAHGVPLHGCPIDALLHEHEKGRQLVQKIADAIDLYAAGVAEGVNSVADAIDGIVKLYPNHIWKEDDMVFPMVARLFPEADKMALYGQFQEVEAKNPPGTHERFHVFAERLSTQGTGSGEQEVRVQDVPEGPGR